MAVRAYARSPAAVVFTLLGTVAVGVVATIGWQLAALFRTTGIATDPTFLGGLGRLLYLVVVTLTVGTAAFVWLPFSAAVAYAVGRRTEGRTATLGMAASAVTDNIEAIARWAKTRLAVGSLDEQLLSEKDIGPNEVVVGCAGFVIPALVLDAYDLPLAVERANRVPPGVTRGWQQLLPLVVTIVAVVAVLVWGAITGSLLAPTTLAPAVAMAVVGSVLTAALDTAWRASVYVSADTASGFSDGP
ncbi:MAG: cellobiose-specific phosphotransferase system component IIC [Natronomonas sp.]|jgi:cellobiose-specific phosphotransferase system component IIC|uniref:hypothetical protein n=1 Tax=Natronomonas sp. TaxID=2184060 RepID=UPI003989C1F8